MGVKEITAVEIDPAIILLGRRYHPEKAYASPKVRIVIDDARSFFGTCPSQFDIISFGFLDAHTNTAMTNIRLDHYVYTSESIANAKSLLSSGGILVVSFFCQRDYITDRMARVLYEVFGEEPICFHIPPPYGGGGVMFIAGDLATVKNQIAQNNKLRGLIKNWQEYYPLSLTYKTTIATDDWPYIYLKEPVFRYFITFWRG